MSLSLEKNKGYTHVSFRIDDEILLIYLENQDRGISSKIITIYVKRYSLSTPAAYVSPRRYACLFMFRDKLFFYCVLKKPHDRR